MLCLGIVVFLVVGGALGGGPVSLVHLSQPLPVQGKVGDYKRVCVSRRASLWMTSQAASLSLESPASRGSLMHVVEVVGVMTRVTDEHMFPNSVWIRSSALSASGDCSSNSEKKEVDRMLAAEMKAHGLGSGLEKTHHHHHHHPQGPPVTKVPKLDASEEAEVEKMVKARMAMAKDSKVGGATSSEEAEVDAMVKSAQTGGLASSPMTDAEKKEMKKMPKLSAAEEQEVDMMVRQAAVENASREKETSALTTTSAATTTTEAPETEEPVSLGPFLSIEDAQNTLKILMRESIDCKEEDAGCTDRLRKQMKTVMREIRRLKHQRKVEQLVREGQRIVDRLPQFRRHGHRRRCVGRCLKQRNTKRALRHTRRRLLSLHVSLASCGNNTVCLRRFQRKILRALRNVKALEIGLCAGKSSCRHKARGEYRRARAQLTAEVTRLKTMKDLVKKIAERVLEKQRALLEEERKRAEKEKREEEERRVAAEQQRKEEEAEEAEKKKEEMAAAQKAMQEEMQHEEESEAMKKAQQVADEKKKEEQEAIVRVQKQMELDREMAEEEERKEKEEKQKQEEEREAELAQEHAQKLLEEATSTTASTTTTTEPPTEPPTEAPPTVGDVVCAGSGVALYPAPNSFEPKMGSTLRSSAFRVVRVVTAIAHQYFQVSECGGLEQVQYVRASDVQKCNSVSCN